MENIVDTENLDAIPLNEDISFNVMTTAKSLLCFIGDKNSTNLVDETLFNTYLESDASYEAVPYLVFEVMDNNRTILEARQMLSDAVTAIDNFYAYGEMFLKDENRGKIVNAWNA